MSHYKVNEKDIFFILKEQLGYGQLCRFQRYSELDEATLDMLVKEAVKFAKTEISPSRKSVKNGAQFMKTDRSGVPPSSKKHSNYTLKTAGWRRCGTPNTGGRAFPK